MNKFIDRKGEHLNKKILIVESVDYDEAGDIKRLYVEEVRNDIPVEVEGTLLNATNLNTIIKQMIKEGADSSNDNDNLDDGTTEVLTDAEKLAKAKEALSLDVTEVTENITLPTVGSNDVVITWAVTEGDAASIEEGVLKVTRGSVDATVKLTATLTLGEATDTKEFTLVVKAKVTYFYPESFSADWTQVQGTLQTSSLVIKATDSSPLYVEVDNDHASSISVTVNKNNLNLIRLTITEDEKLNSISGYTTPVFTFYVRVYLDNDRSVKLGTLTGTITYHFSSVTPDD